MDKGFRLIILTMLVAQSFAPKAQDSIRLSLGDVFRITDSASKKLKLDAINISAAETQMAITKNQQLPDVDFAFAGGYLTDVGVIGLGNIKSGFYSMPHITNSFVLQASYLVFSGGRVKDDIGIVKIQRQIAGFNLEKDKQEIKLVLTGYYLDLYRLMLQRKVYQQNIDQALLMLEKINNRLVAGIALKSDKIRSELMLEDMKLQLLRVNNNILIINNALLETLSLPTNLIIIPVIEKVENPGNLLPWGGLTENALQHEPSIKISGLNIQTAEKKLKQVKASYLPEVSLYFNNGLVRPYVYDIPAKDIYANNLNIGVRVNYSISRLYKNKARMQLAKTETDVARQQDELVKENIRKLIFNAYTRSKEASEQLSSENKKVELATENYRRIANTYNQQLVLITDMTDASIQKLDAELRLSTAKIVIMMRYYELKKATGQLN